jgi:dTDP-4-dehydrorhamnose reductase
MQSNTLEVWAGIESSYTRVKNRYGDQLDYCGHYRRGVNDIEKIAEIGFTALRYPVICERYGTKKSDDASWTWLEQQLNMLRSLKITPIAGLVHHGSGPLHAPLMDPCFPAEIEKYARRIAKRFPWLEFFTPINEPLTTARFCGLYGFWYPHHTSARSFAKIFFNEMKAVVLAIKAIREINPSAKLLQTEDLGKTYGTPLLQYQVEFENERRWLTNDILCGFVKKGHPLWDYFLWLGIPQKTLEFFLENPCQPDVIGLDYYITSERFLDDNLDQYPPHTHGSNGKHYYADVEAIRVKLHSDFGPKVLIGECWERYNIPIAITEVHIHSSPLEQIAWFNYIRNACLELIEEGTDIRAITAWAVFGSFGWSKLLTERVGEYERGVFDASSGELVPTAYTDFLTKLIQNPGIVTKKKKQGWWERESRFFRAPVLD